MGRSWAAVGTVVTLGRRRFSPLSYDRHQTLSYDRHQRATTVTLNYVCTYLYFTIYDNCTVYQLAEGGLQQ